MNILAIETSCDETAAAVTVDGRTVLSNIVFSQTDAHAVFGGVVPEIASRLHVESISQIVARAVDEAGISRTGIDAVAVTAAPGLIGALLTGLSFAKSAAYALGVPLVPVHHIRAHVAANYIAFPELEPPFSCLMVSGGHTLFCDVPDYCEVDMLGASRDDAAGEAFDKVARRLGLPYPGGREMDALASLADPQAKSYTLPRPVFADNALDCSFSGLKTSVINLLNTFEQRGEEPDRALLCRSFNEAVIDILVPRALAAAKSRGRRVLAAAGGVAANSHLRRALAEACEKNGLELRLPPVALCGDNAAMVACEGYYAYKKGVRGGLCQNAFAVREADAELQ